MTHRDYELIAAALYNALSVLVGTYRLGHAVFAAKQVRKYLEYKIIAAIDSAQ
jgi:hypothetical protein